MSETNQPADGAPAPQLPQKKKSRATLGWVIAAAVVVIAVVATVVVVSVNGGKAEASGVKTVSIGVADAAQPYWKTYSALAKKQLNVKVKLVNFTDYSQPNPALSQGQTDLNEFQHIQYLANYNVSSSDDLQPIGATAVYPLTLYSTKYTKASEIPAGSQVAIPNDAINEARGLLVLQAAGLISLKNGGTAFSDTTDITDHTVNVVAVDAAQTAVALQNGSAAASIVNNNFAVDAKLSAKNAIFHDDPSSAIAAPYVNVFVARAKDKNNALYLKLAKLYHDPAVEKGVQASNGGTAVFRTTSAATLQADLAKVETDARAAKK
ncbi:MetQ/NlpA family ABC transporter substrate-binding protein [Microbacterium sp. STN6]|uniref:MetQ/NlpA family ABC transporter substrate-binding protein n=1 Tax=Microbacterium sp. STN6 TaxID=2995588 RepID=UPI002260E024|nr:MetQ/NlpA family ABC transporter substrate-binding protein [Microbacterium sp. STN6]MCX7521791.1 MetQ/NlpA family ABC transporter substrate-binding protein [Microbacterium sp. STN6]